MNNTEKARGMPPPCPSPYNSPLVFSWDHGAGSYGEDRPAFESLFCQFGQVMSLAKTSVYSSVKWVHIQSLYVQIQ